jgi:hypothetical protein
MTTCFGTIIPFKVSCRVLAATNKSVQIVQFAKSYGIKFEGNSVVEKGKYSIHNVRQ